MNSKHCVANDINGVEVGPCMMSFFIHQIKNMSPPFGHFTELGEPNEHAIHSFSLLLVTTLSTDIGI